MSVSLDEDSIDEILYLARADEAQELDDFLNTLSTQTKHSRTDLIAAAVDPHSKNGPLHYAAANGHIDVLKVILPQNLDKTTAPTPAYINAVNDAGNTPLHWAALNGRLECVKLLIQVGGDVTIINKAGHDAVFEAEINDKGDVVDWLLGEVEELEKGIGEAGAGDDDDDMEVENEADEGNSNSADGASATVVEDIRKHLEGMNTNTGPSQGG